MRFRFPKITDAKDHILTALLLVLAMALAIGRHQGGINNIRKISVAMFSYLEEPLSNIRVYREALKTNTALRRQNVRLLDELSRLRATGLENRRLRSMLALKDRSAHELYAVTIVGKELTGLHNSLTIDAGTREGVKVNMPVISSSGLIGKVILTAPNYSQVMPLYNTMFRVSARIQHSQAYGILSWDGKSLEHLELNYVPQTIPIDSGQVVETSGFSNQFPPGIPIGTVTGTEDMPGKEIQRIYVKPYTALNRLTEGFVVKFEPDTSIQNLNSQYEEQFQ